MHRLAVEGDLQSDRFVTPSMAKSLVILPVLSSACSTLVLLKVIVVISFALKKPGEARWASQRLKPVLILPVSMVALTIVFVTLASKQDDPLNF